VVAPSLHYALHTLQRIKISDTTSHVALIQTADDYDIVTFWIATELLSFSPTPSKDFISSKINNLLKTSQTIDKFLREHAG